MSANFLIVFLESLFGYPQSDMHRLIQKFIPFLSHFTTREIKISSFADRLQAQHSFQEKQQIDPEDITILLDATPILIDVRQDEPLSGDNGVWHEKSQHRGK